MNEPSLGHYLTVSGGRLGYDDTGGPGLLVIATPSMGDLRGEYRHVAPVLARLGYRVVTLDVRDRDNPVLPGMTIRPMPRDATCSHSSNISARTPPSSSAHPLLQALRSGQRTTPPPKSEAS
jgi:dienelactone hydrolase